MSPCSFQVNRFAQRVFPIIHPGRRNLTAIRGYVRLGGLPDNPRTDPQDRAWFGPHDRLFVEEESEPIEFVPGPEYGELHLDPFVVLASRCPRNRLRHLISPYLEICVRRGRRAIYLINCGIFATEPRTLTTFLQCGVGDGMELGIWTGRTWILSGRKCPTGPAPWTPSRFSIVET